MNPMLKRLMQRARLMAEHDEQAGSGGATSDDFEIQIEGEEGEPTEQQEQQAETQQEPTPKNDEEEEDEHEGGESAPEGETEEQKRERRRQERQDRKARAKEREESTKRELASERRARQDLERRLAELEGRDQSRDLAQLDEGIARANRVYEQQKQRYQEAIEQHDGEAAARAQEKMLEAREADRQLKNLKANTEQQQRQRGKPANADPAVVSHAQGFLKNNPWYKHGADDVDSSIVARLDQEVANRGFDPASQEYWDELQANVKKYLPHRVAGGKVAPVERQTTRTTKAVVGGNGNTTASGKEVYKLSAARVSALKDAGMWDDPKLRADAIRRYRDYDKQNGNKG